jgi:3-hydroxyisobutyrate dehydrogenase
MRNRKAKKMTKVAVIGTGTMGSAVTRRLLKAGLEVNVWSRNPRPALGLAAFGATAYDQPTDAVEDATIVLTWLPTAQAVSEVMVDGHVLDAMATRAVWAQMGTIGVDATERLNAEVHARRGDVTFVDAPVSGSRGPAENGQLLVLASGPDEVAGDLGPVFDAIGRRTLWLGPAGMGTRMKLVLNTWLAFEVEAAAEGAALATGLGIAPDALASALEGNPVASPLATDKLSKIQSGKSSKIQSGDDRADFSLGWALKDLDLMQAVDGAHAAPVATAIAQRWQALVDSGHGDLDVSAARLGLGEDRSSDPANRPGPAPIHRLLSREAGLIAVTEWANVS